MRFDFFNLNELWGALVIEELSRTGVDCFCISSGSRSTPLTYAVAQNKKITPVIHFDERGAAFYALGNARATGKPASVICTSGTAAANLMPAVIEASVDHVPMILLTADRPPELRQSGANQTINQVRLFGDSVRWQVDIPCPDENISPEFVLTTIDQAVYRACRLNKGPVHLNLMFREPLAPENKKQSFSEYLRSVGQWSAVSKPFTYYPDTRTIISEKTLAEISQIINKSKSGLIVAGKLPLDDSKQVLKLAEKIGWPVFPDIASGLRLGVKSPNIIANFDQILLSDKASKLEPDTVLHFGTQVVSKRLLTFLNKNRPADYIRVTAHPDRLDPNHQVTYRVEFGATDFCERLDDKISKKSMSDYCEKLTKLSTMLDKVMSSHLTDGNKETLSEPVVARIISKFISKQSALFLASSLPVREMDMYADSSGSSIPVEYNRGASGIDGTIASAAGYANGIKKPVTLLIGDLAFLHDLNSLSLVKNSKFPLTIVLLNNDGGGIFSFLPISNIGPTFEKYFGTPHGLSFQKSAEQFDIKYICPKTIDEFKKQFRSSQKSRSSSIIEIKTGRKANFEMHQRISSAIKSELDKK